MVDAQICASNNADTVTNPSTCYVVRIIRKPNQLEELSVFGKSLKCFWHSAFAHRHTGYCISV